MMRGGRERDVPQHKIQMIMERRDGNKVNLLF